MIRGIVISVILIFGAYILSSQYACYKTAGKEYIKAIKDERKTIRPVHWWIAWIIIFDLYCLIYEL